MTVIKVIVIIVFLLLSVLFALSTAGCRGSKIEDNAIRKTLLILAIVFAVLTAWFTVVFTATPL